MDTLTFSYAQDEQKSHGRYYQFYCATLTKNVEKLINVTVTSPVKCNVRMSNFYANCVTCGDRVYTTYKQSHLLRSASTSTLLPNVTSVVTSLVISITCGSCMRQNFKFIIHYAIDDNKSVDGNEDTVNDNEDTVNDNEDIGQLLKASITTQDVHLIVGDGKVGAHKSVLAACSPVFKAMLYGNGWNENNMNEVSLETVKTLDALQQLIDWCYHYEQLLPKLHYLLPELLELIEFFDIAALKSRLYKDINSYLNNANVFAVLLYARLVKDELLSAKCYCYIEKQATVMFGSKRMQEVPDKQLGFLAEAMQNSGDNESLASPDEIDLDAPEEPVHKKQRTSEAMQSSNNDSLSCVDEFCVR